MAINKPTRYIISLLGHYSKIAGVNKRSSDIFHPNITAMSCQLHKVKDTTVVTKFITILSYQVIVSSVSASNCSCESVPHVNGMVTTAA